MSHSLPVFESLTPQELISLIKEQQETIAAQAKEIKELKGKLEELQRKGKRQAAPFSKGKKKTKPKRAGRKPGQGSFTYRKAPHRDEVTEPPVEVPVAETTCPECGEALKPSYVEFAYETELPAQPKPRVTEYRIEVKCCEHCGHKLRGRHPSVSEDQRGATAHRFGDRVMATAHALHYGLGVPMRKVPLILKELSGVEVTQSALQQDACRRSEAEVGRRYEALRASVKASACVHTDDTGWRIQGREAQLMGFETEAIVVYQIRDHHRHQEVQEVIPPDYEGVMITDRGRSYDHHSYDGVKQQKCLAHLLRSIDAVLEDKQGRARWFGQRLKSLLKEGLALWHAYHEGKAENYEERVHVLAESLSTHLRHRQLKDADNQRLLNGIGWHHDRGSLIRFLYAPELQPTNNRAETALRPAVIARKVSQCSKNERGARTYAAFKSVTATMVKTGQSMIEGLYELFHFARLPQAP